MTEQISPLRQRMIDDMVIRNMSPNTQKAYIRAVRNFSRHLLSGILDLTDIACWPLIYTAHRRYEQSFL